MAARIRTVKPEFWCSEQVAECSTNARLLFVGLWNFADDGGIHPASAKQLKMEVFPGDPFTLNQLVDWVSELRKVGLVAQYEAQGKVWWGVTGWHHQKIDKPRCKYPPLQFDDGSPTVRRPFDDESLPYRSLSAQTGVEGKEHSCSPDGEQASDGGSANQYTAEFDAWWSLYPRKIGKRKAFAEFQRAKKRVGLEQLTAGVKAYAASVRGKDPQYIVYAERWLSSGRYDDDLKGESQDGQPSPGSKHDPRHPVTPI